MKVWEMWVVHDKVSDQYDLPKFFSNAEEMKRTVRMIPNDHIIKMASQDYEMIHVGNFWQPTLTNELEHMLIEKVTEDIIQVKEILEDGENKDQIV